ncbi:response regulator [Pelagibius sp. Alg239-R121]|uniref:response regulator n=1 Tax=Pelagibius sp. Alg239-R121 TaxID=2993448 RepID=UPI0024A6CF06|nr:response regulator [Pelagibius sp. Alg239-R121]
MLKFNWHNISIMVVDDNSFMRSLITSTIRALGIKDVVSVPNATQAIEQLKISKTDPVNAGIGSIDIILSDFVMPDVDGILFLRWTRTNKHAPDRFVPFVMVSGQADEKSVQKSRDAGMTEFLAKPFAAQTMADRILEVIQNPRQFVLAADYFGPDRRRMDRPIKWFEKTSEKGGKTEMVERTDDRRISAPSDLQIVNARSNIKHIRDDVHAVIIRPANRLLDKLGPNVMRGQIDFDPLVIQAAEARIQELVGDYSKWTENYLNTLADCLNKLQKRQEDSRRVLAQINHIAHELRGQGGVFDYPLCTAFGKSLYEATLDVSLAVTGNRLKLIDAHIGAIRTVFNQKITGNGGKVGATLLKEIEAAVKKYS